MALNGPIDRYTVSVFAGFQRSVRSRARSVDFYCGGLGFRPDGTVLRLGSETIELLERPALRPIVVPPPGQIDTAFQHIAIVTTDMPAALERLMGWRLSAVTQGGAVTLPASAGGVTAFKFRDPDGHPLELIAFPPGSGNPRWQIPVCGGPTVGIDHSAIVVADAELSIRFYEGTLGFTVSSRQTNHGAEQDRLDGLAGTEVDVVALRPAGAATPHLELLAYRSPPPTPTPAPADDEAADCIVWTLTTVGTPAAAVRLSGPDGHRHELRPAQGR